MEKFAADLNSAHWWVTTIFLAVALNLISSYLKPSIDRVIAVTSSTLRRKVAEARARDEQWVVFARQNPWVLTLEVGHLSSSQFRALGAAAAIALLGFALLGFVQQSSIDKWLVLPLAALLVSYFFVFAHHAAEASLASDRLALARQGAKSAA